MRLAIVCSWLNQYGGAERVLEVLHRMYPQAPVYTAVYRPDAMPASFRSWDIRPTFVDRLPLGRRLPQAYLALYPVAFEALDLRGYDVVLSITSAFAHGVITSAETTHLCYCLTPTRFLWNYHAYIEREGVGRAARLALPLVLRNLRQWDLLAADRVDEFIAISRTVQRRIRKVYRRESAIIYPPVRMPEVAPQAEPEDYYLIVSRLIPYKRIDLAVAAFNMLGLPLRIIGDGRDRRALEALAGPNIQFLGYVPDEEVQAQMAHCRALVLPGEEDFCLTPVEAMGVGRPAVAYGAGGALDTIADGVTGLFFREQTPESLAEAVRRLDEAEFDPVAIAQHARTFDEAHFCQNLSAAVARAVR
ncbi:MAG: glycosyltransferase family 4 protein [Chloroflexi bacterium]|nr:glycosyltransferase family 4 protein [Chloroflexota bacterium]